MCDYVEEAMFEKILRERNREEKILYLKRCLEVLENLGQEQNEVEKELVLSK